MLPASAILENCGLSACSEMKLLYYLQLLHLPSGKSLNPVVSGIEIREMSIVTKKRGKKQASAKKSYEYF